MCEQASSAALASRFAAAQRVEHVHPAHHFVPQKAADIAAFKSFLEGLPPAAAAPAPAAAVALKPAPEPAPGPAKQVAAPRRGAVDASSPRAAVAPEGASEGEGAFSYYPTVGARVWVSDGSEDRGWAAVVRAIGAAGGTWVVGAVLGGREETVGHELLSHRRRGVGDGGAAKQAQSVAPEPEPQPAPQPKPKPKAKQKQKPKQKQKQQKPAAVECTFDNSAGLEFCDIGANLTDRMYSGEYNGKQKHEPDLEAVVARAGAAGVRRLMITGGCLEDAGAALAMARSAGTDGAELFCTVGNPHEYS